VHEGVGGDILHLNQRIHHRQLVIVPVEKYLKTAKRYNRKDKENIPSIQTFPNSKFELMVPSHL
jgi:hypothetical protein